MYVYVYIEGEGIMYTCIPLESWEGSPVVIGSVKLDLERCWDGGYPIGIYLNSRLF